MHGLLSKATQSQSVVAKVLDEIARELPRARPFRLEPAVEQLVQHLHDAAAGIPPRAFETAVATLRAEGISAAALAEVYVPIVARRLGEGWVNDTLDFRAVSVGSARLQSLLWQLGSEWAQTGVLVSSGRPPVLVAVPEGCQHTLGATVLAGQLRYRGISVHLDLQFTGDATAFSTVPKQYSAIFLSASLREPLETLAAVVQKARQGYPATPILLGGNVTDQMADIELQTGVDLVTCDLEHALGFCGLGAAFADTDQMSVGRLQR